jgi:2-polyprenyl-3-methyl-5-hydroxy-6-metoxy-1,4-benzoquinol methylase
VKWVRTVSFAADHEPTRTERWQCKHADGSAHDFDVAVQAGKPLDVLSLKRSDLSQLRDYANFLEHSAARLYGPDASVHRITHCACCGDPTTDQNEAVLFVFGVRYERCRRCGHVFVGSQPPRGILTQLFSDSETHSAAYVDKEALATRMQQVVQPKLHWCLQHFERAYPGRRPASVIDVGAGGGHFVAAVNGMGISADGYELSASSRDFAREAFGLTLRSEDFTTIDRRGIDLVTFWGLLEYVPEPLLLLSKAREVLAHNGMLVVEVPRSDALGTAAQATPNAIVARHMDPTTHIQAFSDESLMTLLLRSGFRPVAAWYFGMDVYELFVQMALRCDNPAILESVAEAIPALQKMIDLGRVCDDIIVAAIPMGD